MNVTDHVDFVIQMFNALQNGNGQSYGTAVDDVSFPTYAG